PAVNVPVVILVATVVVSVVVTVVVPLIAVVVAVVIAVVGSRGAVVPSGSIASVPVAIGSDIAGWCITISIGSDGRTNCYYYPWSSEPIPESPVVPIAPAAGKELAGGLAAHAQRQQYHTHGEEKLHFHTFSY